MVGNEDGAHHVSAELFQALNDVGFTLPANAVTYWVGEAMQSTNFIDLDEIPEAVVTATRLLANCVHLAACLRDEPTGLHVIQGETPIAAFLAGTRCWDGRNHHVSLRAGGRLT